MVGIISSETVTSIMIIEDSHPRQHCHDFHHIFDDSHHLYFKVGAEAWVDRVRLRYGEKWGPTHGR